MRGENRQKKVRWRGSFGNLLPDPQKRDLGELAREVGGKGWGDSFFGGGRNGFVALVGLEVPIAGEGGSAWTEASRALVSVGVWAGRAPGYAGSGAGVPRDGEVRKAASFRPENRRVFQIAWGARGATARLKPGSAVPRRELGLGLGVQPWGARALCSLAAGGMGSGCCSLRDPCTVCP